MRKGPGPWKHGEGLFIETRKRERRMSERLGQRLTLKRAVWMWSRACREIPDLRRGVHKGTELDHAVNHYIRRRKIFVAYLLRLSCPQTIQRNLNIDYFNYYVYWYCLYIKSKLNFLRAADMRPRGTGDQVSNSGYQEVYPQSSPICLPLSLWLRFSCS